VSNVIRNWLEVSIIQHRIESGEERGSSCEEIQRAASVREAGEDCMTTRSSRPGRAGIELSPLVLPVLPGRSGVKPDWDWANDRGHGS
jgi:hypothetical protein